MSSKDETSKVTRFEVITEEGRVYVRYGVNVDLSLQDDGRTLKVFLNERLDGDTQSKVVSDIAKGLHER